MTHASFSRRTFVGGSVVLMAAGCGNRPAGEHKDGSDVAENDDARMNPVIGYWRWDERAQAMHRSDGAAVRFLGIDRKRPATAVTLWMQFEIVTSVGIIRVPVQQRVVGRDENFRALWYKADFRGRRVTPALWAAAERLIGDALSSWPRGKLVDALPTGVGVQGGFAGEDFRDELYRLYLPTYAGEPLLGGQIAPVSSGKKWTLSSPPQPTAASVSTGVKICELTSGTSRIALQADDHGDVRLRYEDDSFESDRFKCTMPYAGQQKLWSILESGGNEEGLRQQSTSFFHMIDNLFGSRRHRAVAIRTRTERLPPEEHERAYAAFHDALFALPANAVHTERLHSPPSVIKSASPWRRAGYLPLNCLTATDLMGPELRHAFLDEPDSDALLISPAGSAFSVAHGVLTAPDGSSLAVEHVDEMLGLTPTRLRMRCRASGLDWPVVVRRIDRRASKPAISWAYQPQLLSRWQIDHDECLRAWRREGHSGLPDPDAWDAMRQFIEEGVLSWGDGPAAGLAPQSLATSGGWYDGEWRGAEFRRLLARPIETGKVAKTDAWQPYVPAGRWHRTDATLIDQPEPAETSYSMQKGSAVPFTKIKDDGSRDQLSARGFTDRHARDTYTRRDLVDYHGSSDHVRLGGTLRHLASTGIVRLDTNAQAADEKGRFAWPPPSIIELPGLNLWRSLRDAAEGGLQAGEAMTVIGGYFFDRLYADSLRITALSAEIDDFDYRMFGRGNDFA